MDDAMALVLREQEALGLDLLTDGEMRRTTFIFHIAGSWDGVDTEHPVVKEIYRNRTANRLVPRITGKIVRRGPAAVDDLRFAKAHTARPLKMAVPGPMTVIDSAANEFTTTRKSSRSTSPPRSMPSCAICRRQAARCCRSTSRR